MFSRLSKFFLPSKSSRKVIESSRNIRIKTMSFPSTLEEFGYAFNDDGILKKIDSETGKITNEGFEFKDQEHYEALGEVITEHVYDLLLKNGLYKIHVPDKIPEEQATFIFANKKDLKNSKKLLVLIHGSGVVRAGQWSRSLIINQSLNHGTQIPYINKAIEMGYDVLVTNTNDNYRMIDGVDKAISDSKTPVEHATNVWKKYVIDSNPEMVGIVAHSYGGVVTIELARKFPKFFQEKVFAVGLTDSVHMFSGLQLDVSAHMKNISKNWVSSNKPLDEIISTGNSDIQRYSAGHPKHEWTSYACKDSLLKFIEEKEQNFNTKNQPKRPKLEL